MSGVEHSRNGWLTFCYYCRMPLFRATSRQPTCPAVEDAGAPKVVAGRYSSRVPLVHNCNCNQYYETRRYQWCSRALFFIFFVVVIVASSSTLRKDLFFQRKSFFFIRIVLKFLLSSYIQMSDNIEKLVRS